MLLNKYTIQLQYLVHRLEETIDIVIKPEFNIYFFNNAANGYCSISIKESNSNEIRFLILNRQ